MKQYDPEGKAWGNPIKYDQCHGKNKYSKHQAHAMKRTIGKSRDKDVRMYECPDCHGWHLTKRGYD